MPKEYKTMTMLDGPSPSEPRYSYAKPTEKPQLGKPKELGINIEEYKLPIIDVCEQRRNFDGYQVNQYFTLADIQKGDESGTTETDAITDAEEHGGHSTINAKRVQQRDRWPNRRS